MGCVHFGSSAPSVRLQRRHPAAMSTSHKRQEVKSENKMRILEDYLFKFLPCIPPKSQTNKGGALYSLFKQKDIKKESPAVTGVARNTKQTHSGLNCGRAGEKMRHSGRGSDRKRDEKQEEEGGKDAEPRMVEEKSKGWRETAE